MNNNDESKNPFDEETIKELEEMQEVNEENTENNTEKENTNNEELNTKDKVNEEFEKKYEELNNKYIRLAADFDNFRKRTTSEKEELSSFTIANVLRQLTGVLDTFDRAQEHLKDIEDCKTVKEGYEVAYKQLTDALKKIGLKEIEALGKEFNPNEHEAVTKIPTDEYEPDCVAAIIQKGYKTDSRIVRPALVGVATKKENQ